MGSFKFLFCLLVAGCATATPPIAADVVVAPVPKVYTCSQEQDLATAWPTLPASVRTMMNDYHGERVTLGRLQGAPGAPTCQK